MSPKPGTEMTLEATTTKKAFLNDGSRAMSYSRRADGKPAGPSLCHRYWVIDPHTSSWLSYWDLVTTFALVYTVYDASVLSAYREFSGLRFLS